MAVSELVDSQQFIQRFARRGGLPLEVVERAFGAMVDELTVLVEQGKLVELHGLGEFSRETIDVDADAGEPASAVVRFSPTHAISILI